MRKILFAAFLFMCVKGFSQVPGYTKINSRYQWLAGIIDSTFHPPLFNGTPNSLRGGSNRDGAMAIDTANGRLYVYHNGAWVRMAKFSEAGGGGGAVDSVKLVNDSLYYYGGGDSVYTGFNTYINPDSVWKVGGNAHSIDALKRIGNKNASPLGLITNNTDRLIIHEDGITKKQTGNNYGFLVIDTVTKRAFYDSIERATQAALVDTAAAIRADFPVGGGTTISDSTLHWVTTNGDSTSNNIKGDTVTARIGKVNNLLTVGDTLKGNKFIYAIGTSITKGSSTEGFPTDSLYYRLFAKRYGLTPVNLGTGGATMQLPGVFGNADSAMIRNASKIPTYTAGSWLVYEFGTNDAWDLICPACDTTQFKIDYNKILDTTFNQRGWPANRVILKTPIPSPHSEYAPRIANYATAVRTLAATRGTHLSDDYAYLTTYGGNTNFLNNWGDSVHPNTQSGYYNMFKTLDDLQLPIKQVGELVVNGGGIMKDTFTVIGRTVINGYQKDSAYTETKLVVNSGKSHFVDGIYLRQRVPSSSAWLQFYGGTNDVGFQFQNANNNNQIYSLDGTSITYQASGTTLIHRASGFSTTGAMTFDANGFQGASIGSAVVVNPTNNQYGYLQARGIAIDNLLRTNPEVSRVGINYLPTATSDAMLTVAGRAKVDSFTMTTGASDGYVLTSDASGKGTWQAAASGTTETASEGLVKIGSDIQLDNGSNPLTRDVLINVNGKAFSIESPNAAISLIRNGYLQISGDTIALSFGGGKLIMNPINVSSQDRLLGQYSVNGEVGYINIGSGLTLSSGTLSATGSGISGTGTTGALTKWASSTSLTDAVAGTDYLTPTGSGAGLSGVVLTTGAQTVAGVKTLSNQLLINAGSAGTPGIGFDGDGNTGIYSAGADQVSIALGGTVYMNADAGQFKLRNAWQLGFGTGDPTGAGSDVGLIRSGAGTILVNDGTGSTSAGGKLKVLDDAYNATSWDGNNEVPTKNAIRDKIESISAGGEVNTASNLGGGLANFDSKSGVDLRFNSFAAADFDLASNLITIDATKWLTQSSAAATYAAISHTHNASDITAGTFADARIAASNVTQHQAALSIATSQLTGTIGTAQIANNSVDGTKIALGSDAQGDVMYYNGTDWVRLAAGTSGHFLKTLGAGANPVWDAAPGGGGGVSDGDKGDVVVSSSGTVYTVESVDGALQLKGITSPSQYTTDQNDVSITGATILRVSGNADGRTISSIAGGVDGRLIKIINSGATDLVIMSDDGATGTSTNRFDFNGTDVIIEPKESREFVYDAGLGRWVKTTYEYDLSNIRRQPMYNWDYMLAGVATANFTTTAISSGTATYTNGVTDHPGYMQTSSSTTTNSGNHSYLYNLQNSHLFKGGEVYECIYQPRVASNTNTTTRFGFLDATTSADAVDGAYFEIPAGSFNVVGKTSNNSTRTTSATIATIAVNTWYRFVIKVNRAASSITFTIYDANGVSLGSQTNSANIPTATGREFGVGYISTNSGTTATALGWLDYQSVQLGAAKPINR